MSAASEGTIGITKLSRKKYKNNEQDYVLLLSALLLHTRLATDIIPLIVEFCHDYDVRFDRDNQCLGLEFKYLPCCQGTTIRVLPDAPEYVRYLAIASTPVTRLISHWSIRIDLCGDNDDFVFGVADQELKNQGENIHSRAFFYRHSRFIYSKNNYSVNGAEGEMIPGDRFAQGILPNNPRWIRPGIVVRMKLDMSGISVSVDGAAWSSLLGNLETNVQYYPMVALYPARPMQLSPQLTVTSCSEMLPMTMELLLPCNSCLELNDSTMIGPIECERKNIMHCYYNRKSIKEFHRAWRLTILHCDPEQSTRPFTERGPQGLTVGFMKSVAWSILNSGSCKAFHSSSRYIFSAYGNQISRDQDDFMQRCEQFTIDGGHWLKPNTTLDFVYDRDTASISVKVNSWKPCTLWTNVDPDHCFPLVLTSEKTVLQFSTFHPHLHE